MERHLIFIHKPKSIEFSDLDSDKEIRITLAIGHSSETIWITLNDIKGLRDHLDYLLKKI